MAQSSRRTAVQKPRRSEPARRGELKKHVGAVHVKGSLTLLERKVSNVLLLNAYDELPSPDVFEHEIRLKTLAELAGFDSNDHALLRASLESLAGTTITWNVLDAEGGEEWGVSTFLAQAVTRGGVCRYAYAPDLRKKLYNPEIYARINLSVQEQFGSGYALALYENCVRFRRVGSTGWIGVDQWRDLLGVEPGQYEPFKYLNRDVLKPAVDEVNRYSDIRVAMERRLERRSVTALKFSVTDNAQLRLELEGGAGRAAIEAVAAGEFAAGPQRPLQLTTGEEPRLSPLQTRLLAFGLTPRQALDVTAEHPAERVEGNLAYVEAEVERGRSIANVAAFTLGAIRTDYRVASGGTAVEREAERRRGAAATKAAAAEREAGERAQRADADARAAALAAEATERSRSAARASRLDGLWAALSAAERARVGESGLERLRAENAALARVYDREQAAGVAEGSIAVRSLLRTYRDEALEATAGSP